MQIKERKKKKNQKVHIRPHSIWFSIVFKIENRIQLKILYMKTKQINQNSKEWWVLGAMCGIQES